MPLISYYAFLCQIRIGADNVSHILICPVRFAEKTSRNTVSADLLSDKNIIPAEKIS